MKTYNYIEIEVQVKYRTLLGDHGTFTADQIQRLVDNHIEDYAEEHGLDPSSLKVVHVSKLNI